MAASAEERRAQRLQDLVGDTYEDFDGEGCKEEITRLSKIKMDFVQTKKDQNATMSGLIKDTQDKIEYLVERIDFLQHEIAVQQHLGTN